MAIINVLEGQCQTVIPTDTLQYPGIDSCLSITCVLPQITRVAGHAVFVPAAGQLGLQQICEEIMRRKGDFLHIIGNIGLWDQNWPGATINGHAVGNVTELAAAMGYTGSRANLFDTEDGWGSGSFNVWFGFENNHRSLWAVKTQDQSRHVIPGRPSW